MTEYSLPLRKMQAKQFEIIIQGSFEKTADFGILYRYMYCSRVFENGDLNGNKYGKKPVLRD